MKGAEQGTGIIDVRVSAIVALSENGVIGRENRLPWHLSEDLKYFKRVTFGKPVITGRKNHESIGRLLPGRLNIIVTRQPDYRVDGARMVGAMQEALELAIGEAERAGLDEVFVIGGGEIYAQAMPWVRRLYLTRIHRPVEGDVYFPPIPADFSLISREERSESEWTYSWEVWER